jgi:quercetin dioxygenase-like cupin family protein
MRPCVTTFTHARVLGFTAFARAVGTGYPSLSPRTARLLRHGTRRREKMFTPFSRRALFIAAQLLMIVLTAPVQAQPVQARPDPSVLNSVNWDQLQWLQDGRPTNPGSWYAILSGNPSTGPWVVVNKVAAGSFDQPHFHTYDRYIYVIKGTWWTGAGANLNINDSVATPPGSYVKHSANQVHWDGAKNEDVLLLISGDGPFNAPAQDNFVK